MTRSNPLIVGNWKMNGRVAGLAGYAADLKGAGVPADLVVCPPAPLLPLMAEALAGGPIAVGAQDCHFHASGAHTGDLSPMLLVEVGCRYAIVGHSERRQDHHETDQLINAKAAAAQAAGLIAIVCVGETAAERAAGRTLEVVERQVRASVPHTATASATVIAYEPVWAIGTGAVPTADDIAAVHAAIRGWSPDPAIRVLYGGSVKPTNAAAILALANVDGVLVGGACLVASDFLAIARAARAG